jgi:hypothetical protein
MSRRPVSGINPANQVGQLITDAYRTDSELIEALAARIQANSEGVEPETIEAWKKALLECEEQLSSIKAKASSTQKVLSSEEVRTRLHGTGDSNNNVSSSSSSGNSSANPAEITEIFSFVKRKIDEDMKATFDPKKVPLSVNVRKILKIRSGDEEFEVVEDETNERTFKCPYTQKMIVRPMKSNNCMHRVSYDAYVSMTQNLTRFPAKCPVAGCPKLWQRNTTSDDHEFQSKLEKFLALKATQAERNTQQGNSANASDDYTAL